MSMNLTTLINGEPWMTPEERELNHHLIRDIAESLAAAGVHETALVTLRVNDVAATWLLARRLESALTPAEGEPPPCPTPAQAGAIGKCRDRLRRAIKELEACCPRDAAPIREGLGLIEKMHDAVRVVRANRILDEPAASEHNRNYTTHTPHNPPKPHPNQITSPVPPQNPSPTASPPPPNRKARRLQAREERRNRTGRSKTPLGRTAAQSPRSNDTPGPPTQRPNQTAVGPNAGVRPDPG